MTYFIKSGNTYQISDESALDIKNILPARNYVVKFNEMKGFFFLEEVDDFEIPTKMYGNVTKNSGRIISTFLSRSMSTGVLLTGEKGSGKTLLSKRICIDIAKEHQVPTLVINTPFNGDGFNKFIQSINQPCVVLFDEFEKTFDSEEQEKLLTLLDGVFGSKKLFLLTCNNKYRIDSHMMNRPGRIFYAIDFKGLDVQFIREYCEDVLINKDHIEKICQISNLFSEFNFDMLKALVEEMNRYNESPQEAMNLLNAKPQYGGSDSKYEVKFFIDKLEVFSDPSKDKTIFYGNPLTPEAQSFTVFNPLKNSGNKIKNSSRPTGRKTKSDLFAAVNDMDDLESSGGYDRFTISLDKLVRVDANVGCFEFNDKGTKIVLVRMETPEFNINAF